MRIITLTALLLLAGCTANARSSSNQTVDARDAAELAKALDGLTPGKPQTCINPLTRRYETKTIGNTILYRVDRNLVYRTEAPGCSRAATGDALISNNFGSQLCSGQILQTVDLFARFETGSCSLGEFTPYTRAK
ncbi:MAG: hypothetical protein K2X59_05040 [Sphingomonas sp.]|nr:hypothetical protein [Sphingomonas sp.]